MEHTESVKQKPNTHEDKTVVHNKHINATTHRLTY